MLKIQRHGRLAGTALLGALALTACGTDNNTTTTGQGSRAPQGGAGTTAGGTSAGGATSGSTGTGSSTDGASGAACPSGTINAEGSSAQQNAMDAWISGFQETCNALKVNYNPTGSGAGIQSFVNGNVAFAGSDSALKPEEKAAADKRCATGKAINLPMVVGPVAVAYNLPGVEDLQLSPATVAGIFAGKIKTWDAAEVKKDNPQAQLPSTPIQPVHRSDESGTTDNFTRYLAAAAPSVWTYEPAKAWPTEVKGGLGATKSNGVADAVKNTEGAISYMEQSFAENANLGMARLGVGSQFVELNAANAGRAVEAAQVTGTGNDLALKLDYATKTAGAYPLILVTYEITCEKGLPAEQAQAVKAFLTYTAGSEGQGQLEENGYAPLPASLQQKVQQSVSALS